MAGWRVEFTREAEKDLGELDRGVRRRIIEKIDWLSKHFDQTFPLALHAEFHNFYKVRVGEWRIVYKASWREGKIMVCLIGKRDKIYKK